MKRSRPPIAPTLRSTKSNYCRLTTIIRRTVRARCLEPPGYSYNKRGPGALGKSSIAVSHYHRYVDGVTVFEGGLKGAGLPSEISNAFHGFKGLKRRSRFDIG